MRTRWTRLGVLAACVAAVLAGSSPARAADTNVALHAVATAYSNNLPALPCSPGSGPEKAVDGRASNIYTDKWCVPSGQPILVVTLPKIVNNVGNVGFDIHKIVVKHAGFAGESRTYNTRNFRLWVRDYIPCSYLGPWALVNTSNPIQVAAVTNNSADQTVHNTNVGHVAQVLLLIDAPTQQLGGATRIYDVEVWGAQTPFDAYPCGIL